MGYFRSTRFNCDHYPNEWSHVLNQIQKWTTSCTISKNISQALEAKALYIFTMARRLTRAADWLRERANGWTPVFLEATVLLFPMIELIGHSRVDRNEVKHVFDPQKGKKDDVSAVNLWAGLHWLRDPGKLLTVRGQNQREDTNLLSKWEIGHLVSLRHYLLHGAKQVSYGGSPVSIEDIISYEFPDYVVKRSQEVLPEYWQQLRQDDGTQGWIGRLAQADIRPLKLQGSGHLEEGLIDLDIIDCLEGSKCLLS